MLELELEKTLYKQVSLTTQVKKLVLVLTTFLLMTGISMGVEDQQLECIPSIQYLVKFKKSLTKFQALLDSGSKINVITTAYTAKLELRVCFNDVRA